MNICAVYINKHYNDYIQYICGGGGGKGGLLFLHLRVGGGGERGSSHVCLFRFIDHEFLASDHMAPQPEARQDAKIGQNYKTNI
jgi:hypothetical protein